MGLLKEHIQSVCRASQGAATCSFLTFGAEGFVCAKGTGVESVIRARQAAGEIAAKGDNCSGPPHFQNIAGN